MAISDLSEVPHKFVKTIISACERCGLQILYTDVSLFCALLGIPIVNAYINCK